MKAYLQADSRGRVSVPPEKRFLIGFFSRPERPRAIVSARFPVLTMVALLATAVSGAVEGAVATFRYSGTDLEGLPSFQLGWIAKSNATYLVQSATNLAADAWRTVAAVTPADAAGQYEIKGRSIPENSREFFRLVLPQPEIFSVEPAVLVPGVAANLYIVGQCFDSSVELWINDVVQTNVTYTGSIIT